MSRAIRAFAGAYRVQIIVLVVVWCGFASTNSLFRGPDGVYAVLIGFSLLGLVAMGLATTMIAGELDLSAAGVAACGGAVAVRTSGSGDLAALLLAVLFGLVVGLLQGAIIAWLRINSLVITVATMVIFVGLSYVLCDSQPITVARLSLSDPFLDRFGVFSLDIVVALVVMACVGLFIAFTRPGREIVAIGGARDEARAAGVNVRRPVVISFALSGTTAALAGSMASLKAGSVAPGAFGSLLLEAVSAALIGGISLYGGRGSGPNVFLGVAIMSLVAVGLGTNGAQDYTVQLVTGLILFGVVILEFVSKKAATSAGDKKEEELLLKAEATA